MMTRNLLEIVAMCGGVLHAAQGTADSVRATTVTGVFTDSRKVAPGGLFVAIAGEHDDGHQFVPAAARAGAVAALLGDPGALAGARRRSAAAGARLPDEGDLRDQLRRVVAAPPSGAVR